MKNYEVTFIVDPVLSADEIKSTAQTYQDMLEQEGSKIIAFTEIGLKQLAYEIKKRNSGIYFSIEFESETGEVVAKLELALRRDERIMRFLTVHLDKYGVKYNADKRAGKIGKAKDRSKKEEKEGTTAENTNVKDLRKSSPLNKPETTPIATETVEEPKTDSSTAAEN